ncbi:hypothetical protein LTR85_008393 [Meristemomyces frigidus]|nr:hypothetical protein LTR85_008393 [Meristemomyces frigidus]
MASVQGQVERRCRQRDVQRSGDSKKKRPSHHLTTMNVPAQSKRTDDPAMARSGRSWTRFFHRNRAQTTSGPEHGSGLLLPEPRRTYKPRYAERDAIMCIPIQDRDDVVAQARRHMRRRESSIRAIEDFARRRNTLEQIGFTNHGGPVAGIGRQSVHPNMRLARTGFPPYLPASLAASSSQAQVAEHAEGSFTSRPAASAVLPPATLSTAIGHLGQSRAAQDSLVHVDEIAEAVQRLNIEDKDRGSVDESDTSSLQCGASACSPGRYEQPSYHHGVTDAEELQALGLALPYQCNGLGDATWQTDPESGSDGSSHIAAMSSSHERAARMREEGEARAVASASVSSAQTVVPSSPLISTDVPSPISSSESAKSSISGSWTPGWLTEDSRNASSTDTAATALSSAVTSPAASDSASPESTGPGGGGDGRLTEQLTNTPSADPTTSAWRPGMWPVVAWPSVDKSTGSMSSGASDVGELKHGGESDSDGEEVQEV